MFHIFYPLFWRTIGTSLINMEKAKKPHSSPKKEMGFQFRAMLNL